MEYKFGMFLNRNGQQYGRYYLNREALEIITATIENIDENKLTKIGILTCNEENF